MIRLRKAKARDENVLRSFRLKILTETLDDIQSCDGFWPGQGIECNLREKTEQEVDDKDAKNTSKFCVKQFTQSSLVNIS